jgi:hypothetical protein
MVVVYRLFRQLNILLLPVEAQAALDRMVEAVEAPVDIELLVDLQLHLDLLLRLQLVVAVQLLVVDKVVPEYKDQFLNLVLLQQPAVVAVVVA